MNINLLLLGALAVCFVSIYLMLWLIKDLHKKLFLGAARLKQKLARNFRKEAARWR